MRKALTLIPILLLVALPAAAQDTDDAPLAGDVTSGSFEIGYGGSSLTGSPDFVSRYLPADYDRPLAVLSLESHPEWGNVSLSADFKHEDDQKHFLAFDVNRVLRFTSSYTRLLPRQGHDPMTNLEGATTHGRVVRHTDTDPHAIYDHTYGLFEGRAEIQPSGLSALTVGLNYRDQHRDGTHQTMTIAHCDNCHVVSQSRPIEEKLSEASVDATVSWVKGYLKGSFAHRQLREDVPSIDFTYDRALHPELRAPVFQNRVQYDSLDGALPVDYLQDTDKNIGRAKLQLSDVGGFVISAGGVWSGTENKFTGLNADYKGYNLNIARRVSKKFNVRFRGRAYFLDNDDVFVDTVEPLGMAGPQAGKTYREIYGYDPDFLRQSSLNRDVYESNLDLSYKLGRKAGSIKAMWKYKGVDRKHFQVAPGETKTTTNVLGLAWRPRPAKGLRLVADYRHGDVDRPFMNVDGGCSQLVSPGPLPSPFHPLAAQYYESQSARIADTTGGPSKWDELKLRATYIHKKASFGASYRYWDGSNSTGDLTDWSRKNQLLTANLAYLASETWDWFVAYSWGKLELGSPACIPLFDG